ncbi:MAG TPA: ribonuclease Z [bacterium]|nr:ribonuclease Z [bacterium]
MKLTILGSGSAIPVPERNPASYLLDIGGQTVLLDSGSGASRQIARAGRTIKEISKLFYTHFHIDHIGDLPSLLFAIKNSDFAASTTSLDIYAHQNFMQFLATFENLYGDWIKNPDYPYEFHPLEGKAVEFDNFVLKLFPANHNPESLIFRFESRSGKSLVYTGDTDYCDSLVKAARNADLLLTECSFPDNYDVKGHLSPSKVRKVVKKAKPKQVILTHLYPNNDDSTLIDRIGLKNDRPIKIARDLEVIQV